MKVFLSGSAPWLAISAFLSFQVPADAATFVETERLFPLERHVRAMELATEGKMTIFFGDHGRYSKVQVIEAARKLQNDHVFLVYGATPAIDHENDIDVYEVHVFVSNTIQSQLDLDKVESAPIDIVIDKVIDFVRSEIENIGQNSADLADRQKRYAKRLEIWRKGADKSVLTKKVQVLMLSFYWREDQRVTRGEVKFIYDNWVRKRKSMFDAFYEDCKSYFESPRKIDKFDRIIGCKSTILARFGNVDDALEGWSINKEHSHLDTLRRMRSDGFSDSEIALGSVDKLDSQIT